MKKSSIIILIIAILVIIAGVAIYMITNQKSTNNSSINLKTMIDTIYKNSNVELPSLETKKIGLSDNNVVSSYTFLSNNDNVEELVVSEPVMSSQAYSLVAIKLKNNANIEQVKQEIYDNVDMNKWICVSAEKFYITDHNNVIFYVMSYEDWAKPVYDSFKKYVNNEVGKELEKSENSDYELPPEMIVQ